MTAIVLGPGAGGQSQALGQYGAKRVLIHEDQAYEQFLSEPAADTLATLVEQEKPDLLLIGTTYNGRDIASRLKVPLLRGLAGSNKKVSTCNSYYGCPLARW